MASSQPASPAMAPARMKVMNISRSTLMPARKAATALPPISVMWRPKGVRLMMKEKTTKQSDGDPGDERHMKSSCSMPMTRSEGARSWAERPPEIATTRPRTQM